MPLMLRRTKVSMTDPGEKYATRAAQRLNQLLQEQGAPLDLPGRSRLLAQRLQIAQDHARQLLGGFVPWDWEDLDRACRLFDKPAGFFLDERPSPSLPTDTQVLTSVEGNENIVFRAPAGFLAVDPPAGRWRYGTAREGDLFASAALVLFVESDAATVEIQPGRTYALRSDEGVSFLRCEKVQDARVHFSDGSPGGLHQVLPLASLLRGEDDESGASRPRIAGPVLATIERR